MEEAWSILGIEPTADTREIKRAYARLAGKYHPEEEPEKFLQLRKAYQDALRWAETQEEPEPKLEEPGGRDGRDTGGWQIQTPVENTPNPYRDCPAIRTFAGLYTGKQRRDPKAWMDFFTSSAFLSVMREPDFTAQLLEEVSSRTTECPPAKEFLTWLAVAYQYNQEEAADETGKRGRQFRMMHGAQFDGIESVFRIALLGPRPKRFVGNELALFISFQEYNRLNALADAGNWSEPAFAEASQHLGRYSTCYLHEKCSKREWNDTQRHPAGLRLLEEFFRRGDVPEELYRILWQKLDLKSAVFGRAKILYHNLRELVQERVPGIIEEEPENFLQLNREHSAYCVRIQNDPEREDAESAALFERADFQKALRSRRFIEEQLLSFSCWMSDKTGDGFLRRIQEFYQEHPDLPYAEQIQGKVRSIFRERRVKRWNAEDRDAEGVEYYERLTLQYRPFFRHWLNTGFYTARDPESNLALLTYLNNYLPYLPDWSRRFLTKKDGTPRTIAVSMGKIEITLHQRYMSFEINGDPVYRPCLAWEDVLEEGGEAMFYLLPITLARYSQYKEVRLEIFRRLNRTAALPEDYELIAMCLAGMVCRLPDEPEKNPLPLEIYAEDAERLYGVTWFEREGLLLLFEQTFDGRRPMPNGEFHDIFDEKEAIAKAKQLLEQTTAPGNYDLSLLKELPFQLYALPLNAPEVELSVLGDTDDEDKKESDLDDDGEDGDLPIKREEKWLAPEIVSEYLRQFAGGKLLRLQLDWYSSTLVFVKDQSGCACFYFPDEWQKTTWYTLISQPDIYQNMEHDQIRQIPFGMGKLPEYCLFHDPAPIMSKLDLILMSIGRGGPQMRAGGSWLWSSTTNLQDGEHKRMIAKIKLAGYPPRRQRNYPLRKFIISRYPSALECVDNAGEKTTAALKSGSYGQASAALIQFMQKKLARLRLTWTAQSSGVSGHLILLRDQERYMMAWLQDGKRRAEFCTAAGSAEKVLFYGRAVPAQLVHDDLKQIRSCLDLMLDDMSDPSPITDRLFTPDPESCEEMLRELTGIH